MSPALPSALAGRPVRLTVPPSRYIVTIGLEWVYRGIGKQIQQSKGLGGKNNIPQEVALGFRAQS